MKKTMILECFFFLLLGHIISFHWELQDATLVKFSHKLPNNSLCLSLSRLHLKFAEIFEDVQIMFKLNVGSAGITCCQTQNPN